MSTIALPRAVSRRLLAWFVVALAAVALSGLGLVAPAALLIVLPFAVATLLATLRWPEIGALLLVASVPVQQLGSVGPLTFTRACLPLALLGYAALLIVARRPLVFQRFTLLYLGLLGVMVASATQAASVPASAAELARWAVAGLALVVLIQFFGRATPRRLLVLLAVIAAAGALQALLGLAQTAIAAGPASFRVGGAFTRAYGAFGRPNSFAGYLELTLFPAFWTGMFFLSHVPGALDRYRHQRLRGMLAGREARRRLAWSLGLTAFFLGAAAITLTAIVASFSRGAWLGVATAGLLTVALYQRWTRVILAASAPLIALALLGGASQVLPTALTGRVSSIVDEARPFDASSVTVTPENFATVERMAHWQAGWRMFEDHPALGVGVGNFNTRYPDYFVRAEFRHSQGHTHNVYIQMLAETGMAGLLAFLVVNLSFIFLALRVVTSAPAGFARMVALGALGTLVSVATHNVFEDLQVLNLGIQLSAIWTLVIAAHWLWRTGDATLDNLDVEYSRA